MAKFKNDNLDLETGENIDFDDADSIKMGYDGTELYINSTISGVRAVQPHHMVRYDQLTESSGILQDQIDNIDLEAQDEFIELIDTPATYSGMAGYGLSVNTEEDALEFNTSSLLEGDLYIETTYVGSLASQIDAWRDNSKTFKTYKETITRTGGFVSQVVTEVYDVNDGVSVAATYTNTYTRANGRVVSETQVRT
jgi:hypothetical protein